MDRQQFIDLYNPANAKALTQEQVDAMANFTRDEIKALAEAYPNKSTQPAYLVLKDKSKAANKQSYPLSTFKNLWALIRGGNSNYVAFSFRSIFDEKKTLAKLPSTPVQDINSDNAKEELKSSSKQAVKTDKEKETTGQQGTGEQNLNPDANNGQQGPGNNEGNQGGDGQQGGSEKQPIDIEDLREELEGMKKGQLQERYELELGSKPDDKLTVQKLVDAIVADAVTKNEALGKQ